jgi:dUTP pyrophosphatase
MTTKVLFKSEDRNAKMPTYATDGSAGMDFYAAEDALLYPGRILAVSLGFSVQLPPNTVLMVCPRSGLAAKNNITVLNAPGIIDSDFRGVCKVILHNANPYGDAFSVKAGDRIAQGVLVPYLKAEFIESELDETIRGNGGFGSTGE